MCVFAREKLKRGKGKNNKIEPVPLGWQPICTAGLEFEMTDLLTRPPNSQGMPDFSEQATKMQDQHRSMFMTDGAITDDMGPALTRSAEGAAAARNDLPSDEEAVKQAQEALNIASPGADRPNVCWQGLSKALRRHRRPAKRPPPPPSGATATFELSKLHQPAEDPPRLGTHRSEEHTSELQSLMRNSYAVFCLKKKKKSQPKRTI